MNIFFIYLLCGWGICFGGYIVCNKMRKYNNLIYYDLSNKIIKYKRSKNKTHINNKN